MMSSVIRSSFLAALLLVAGLGCSLSDGTAFYTTTNSCESNADCSEGFCDLERKMCLSNEAEANYEIFLTVTPVESASSTPTTNLVTSRIEVGSLTEEAKNLQLVRPVTLAAFVQQGELPIEAELRLTRRASTIGEEPVVVSGVTLDEPISAEDGKPANFTARVLPGHTYDVTIFPQADGIAAFPPIRQVLAVPMDASFVRLDGVAYPTELDTITGRVRNGKGAGISELVIRAVDPVTRLVISSRGLTDAQGGFVIKHMRGSDPYLLQLQAEGSSGNVPIFLADPAKLITGAAGEKIVVVPELERTSLELVVLDPDGEKIEGAVVQASTDELELADSAMRGWFTTSQTTGADGTIDLPLFVGKFDFVITPPSASARDQRLAVAEFSLLLTEPIRFEQALSERVTVAGVVLYDQAPMPGVDVHAFSNVTESARFRAHRSGQSTVGNEGSFSIHLDLGEYDLVTRPPRGTGLGWAVLPGFVVSDVSPPPTQIELQPPVPLHGRVTSADQELVIGAIVRAYAIVEDGDDTRSVLVARAETDDIGEYELLLPLEI